MKKYNVFYWVWKEDDFKKHMYEAYEKNSEEGYYDGWYKEISVVEAGTPEEAAINLLKGFIEKGAVRKQYICADGSILDYSDHLVLNGKVFDNIYVETAPRNYTSYSVCTSMFEVIDKAIM